MINKVLATLKHKSKIFNVLISIFYSRSTNESISESFRRKKLDIFNISELAKPIKRNAFFHIPENNFYGHGYQLLNFIGKTSKSRFTMDFMVEHGLIFGNLVQRHTKEIYLKKVFTFSEYRKKSIFSETLKDVTCIGPYIHYAEDIYDANELLKIKYRLGKTLLVFPTHSIDSTTIDYDKDQFYDFINKNNKYDTVLICMYWKDIELGKHHFYKDKGYEIVTAGHIYDLFFLSRLKIIIGLCDMVLANSIGTFLGYCIFLNKPVCLFNQTYNKVDLNGQSNLELNQRPNNSIESRSYIEVEKRLIELFSNYNEEIYADQYEFVKYLFGFDFIRNKEQLKKLIC